jgi:hypothetical protein
MPSPTLADEIPAAQRAGDKAVASLPALATALLATASLPFTRGK